MKRSTITAIALVLVVAFVAGGSIFALAGGKGKEITVIGTLIDTKCYGMDHDNLGTDHMTPKGKMPNCAQACSKMGVPVGVLKGGKKGADVFILVTPSMGLAEHMAKEVKVIGMQTFEGAITPSKIFVKNAKGKWEEVKVGTMM